MQTSASMELKIREMQPLVILGMHRSGTSLVVRLLNDLGIFLGRRLSRDAEDIYFQKLNRRIYNSVGVGWGNIDALLTAMQTEDFIERWKSELLMELFTQTNIEKRSKGIARYFGSHYWESILRDERIWWGWKDPRNTLTFPIWMRVFPNAYILHIMRNGIDVAISTHRRSLRQKKKFWKRLFPLDYCPITLDFEYCFWLWERHTNFVMDHRSLLPADHYLEVRYEDLLLQPENVLNTICDFINYPVVKETLSEASKRIDNSRLDNSENAKIYQNQIPALLSSPMMQQLGYDYNMSYYER